jgi:hypothetical protein
MIAKCGQYTIRYAGTDKERMQSIGNGIEVVMSARKRKEEII